jgi:hypothetical protein
MSADDQQERLDTNWIIGFVDGEGCFHISINRMNKMSLGWQVLPEFRVVQNQNDEQVLYRLQRYFGYGNVTINREDQHGIRKEFRVRGIQNLNKLIDFFSQHPLQTISKQQSFKTFSEVIKMINKKEHLTQDGLNKIAKMISKMNRKPKLKYLESSETIRQTP